MKPELKEYIAFKVKQHLNITGQDINAETIRATMNNKELLTGFIREAIAAGV